MTRNTVTLACCIAVALTACNRGPEAPAAEPALVAAPVADATPPAAAAAVDATPAAFDMRAYAGAFASGEDRLELAGDGSYRLTERGATFDGTWTAEQANTRIRLDPNSKSEPDRVFAMAGRDRLNPVDDGGQPIAGSPAWTREASAVR